MALVVVVNRDGKFFTSWETWAMEKFVVAYAKIITDKDGVNLEGVYFGGLGNTIEEANEIAHDCVNRIRGGSILSKVLRIDGKHKVLDVLYEASDKFEFQTVQMQEAEKIINRTQGLK
tara:strand:+ start:3901 stop:4254 length:354 start_codon:yes stop_codon:yes gene_type:complete